MILVVMVIRIMCRSPAAGEAKDGEGELYPQCDQLPGDPGEQVCFFNLKTILDLRGLTTDFVLPALRKFLHCRNFFTNLMQGVSRPF